MKALLATALLMPSLAWACEPDEAQVFSCTTAKGKVAQVCQAADTVNYRFGQIGKPEMEVKVPSADLKWEQDAGSGGGTDDLHFPNGDTTYQISYSEGWGGGQTVKGARIYVMRNGKQAADLQCADGTVEFASDALKAEHRPYE